MSLWLSPQKPSLVKLERFAWYPHFLDNLEDTLMGHRGKPGLPEYVTVRWKKYDKFLFTIETDDEEDDQEEWAFIDHVAELIGGGADVPPLVARRNRPEDGIHRAWAARKLGLEVAPVIDLTEM